MTLSDDLESYTDGMRQDITNGRLYGAGDVSAVAGYIREKASEIAHLEMVVQETVDCMRRFAKAVQPFLE